MNPAEGEDSVENDDFVPLGYLLAAVFLCAVAVYFTVRGRRRRRR